MRFSAIIIGAGPSGIAMAYKLKHELEFEDFIIYEKMDGVGGTWRANDYPGCGCDVPSHLYSFSFNLNPNWSRELCQQSEILEYLESTVDKFSLRSHVHTSVECTGAEWDSELQLWSVKLRDLATNLQYTRQANVFVSAVGGISFPRDVKFPGMERFKGPMFHTARWNHTVDYKNKRMAVIGNGCSAAQVVPSVADSVKTVKQYARTPQWYHERPNHYFTSFEKFVFRYIPLAMRYLRLKIFWDIDRVSYTYRAGTAAERDRLRDQKRAVKYIHDMAPSKYHSFLVPEFELGCKRRIADPDYLISLHKPTVEVLPEGIQEITEDGIISSSGREDKYDIIVLATGFQVSQFLTPMEIIGRDGKTLNQQWKENRGAQAYLGTFVHNFPNMAILFGPNTFPANNSALFACEVQVEYTMKALFAPLFDSRAAVMEVRQVIEDRTTNETHLRLRGSVFSGNCSSWYIGEFGRNAASWPGMAWEFWAATFFPDWSAFDMTGGSNTWPINRCYRSLKKNGPVITKSLLFCAAALAGKRWLFNERDGSFADLGRIVAQSVKT